MAPRNSLLRAGSLEFYLLHSDKNGMKKRSQKKLTETFLHLPFKEIAVAPLL